MFYRSRQFFNGFFAQLTTEEEQLVRQRLSPAEFALFSRMPLDARRHSLNVYLTLERTGNTDPDLAVAALLHDVGKVAADVTGVKLGLWVRIPLVLMEATHPKIIRRLASPDPNDGWRYTLNVHLEHPEIGAAMAARAGSSRTACWLIASHQNRELLHEDEWALSTNAADLLLALQQADSQN